MRRAEMMRIPHAVRLALIWFASVSFVATLAGCGAFATAPPTVSPELLKIDAIETQMRGACDDFIRQQATLAAEGGYDLAELEEISLDELPDGALSLQVERAYSDALAVFDNMDSDSPDADAARAMIARIAPMQRHAKKWEDALMSTVQDIFIEEFPDVEITPVPAYLALSEWRNRAVELCADW